MRKVFLDDLPRFKDGANKGKIDWKQSVNCKVKFIYDGIEGNVNIINYFKESITIDYNSNKFVFSTSCFPRAQFGRMLKNELKKISSDFKIKIGTRFKDDKRDITIIDREYRKDKNNFDRKWYKYKCNQCGWSEGWKREDHILSNITKCSNCSSYIVEGLNDITTVAPWMVKYFQGGIEEAKLYTCSSNQLIYPICPDCGRVKKNKIKIGTIYNQKSIGCSCSDSTSYPEKIMFNILEQLGLDFQTQLSKTTFEWCDKYRYDFYFEYNNKSYICEVNGGQHYQDSSRGRSLQEEQENDKLKKELALSNGIKKENYIVIDCRYSELDWIKNNDNGILNSKLAELFDLDKIDWIKCEEFALNNLVKIACTYKKNNPYINTIEIGKIMKYTNATISKWLKQGDKLGWCDYNPKEEQKRNITKQVEMFQEGKSLGIFESTKDIERKSKKLFGIELDAGNISKVCNGKRKHTQGFTFKYIENLVQAI